MLVSFPRVLGGIQSFMLIIAQWIPAFAGMTDVNLQNLPKLSYKNTLKVLISVEVPLKSGVSRDQLSLYLLN